MKQTGFTLAEQLIVIVILGILVVAITTTLKPNNISEEALKKAGKSLYIQIEFVTKQILARNTNNYTLTRMVDSTGEFSIDSSSSLARLTGLYKKGLMGLRQASVSSSYLSRPLTDGTNSPSGLSPSSFSGFTLKNGAYFGTKLNGNCTTTIDYIYDPSTPDTRSKTNTCGSIFFDVNGDKEPNTLGIDQYIVALGKLGVK